MGYALEKFASECHDILAADSGVAGREKVRTLLTKALVDETFVAENFPDSNDAPRSILYEDDELGFAICSHVYKRGSHVQATRTWRTLGDLRSGRGVRPKCSTMNSSMLRPPKTIRHLQGDPQLHPEAGRCASLQCRRFARAAARRCD